jgi:S-layer homology domain
VPGEKVYPDVNDSHWGYGYIYAATKTGLFTGYEDGSFHPDSYITRAEATVVISKYLKLNKVAPFSINFTDINNHWAASFIEEIYRVKFIEGYLEDNVRTFKPDANIKRSEAVTIFNNVFFRGPLKLYQVPFNDITKDHWAYEQVAEASGDHSYIRDGKFETKVDK